MVFKAHWWSICNDIVVQSTKFIPDFSADLCRNNEIMSQSSELWTGTHTEPCSASLLAHAMENDD